LIEEFLAALSLLGFILFFVKGKSCKFFGAIGWTGLVAMIFANFPEYIHENNIAYPLIAILSLPLLYATVKLLINENETVFMITKGAAVAFLIFAPFAYIQPLGNLLILANVYIIQVFLSAIGFSYTMASWNMFMHDIFRVEIILGCTGIQAIAVLLGTLAAIPPEKSHKALSAVIIIAAIMLMNFIRNIFVILAYTLQWFQYFPEIASNGQFGYESYFWAHNVISEFGLSLFTIIILGIILLRLNPQLKDFLHDIFRLYKKELGIKSGRISGQ